MARIRSVHPTLFTDEAWVACSAVARLLYIGLWTDADDQGVFEWKPLQIKMRLLAGDDLDAAILLAELLAGGLVARFEAGGRSYGAIKAFRAFQRPKKPNAVHPLPLALRPYVGLTDADLPSPEASPMAELFPHRFGTGSELSPQMEDGGGREGEGEEDSSPDGDSSVSEQVPGSIARPESELQSLSTAHPTPARHPEEPQRGVSNDAPPPAPSGLAKPRPPNPGDPARQAYDAWNALAARLDLPTARRLDDARRRAIRARLADGGLANWALALQAVERSPFLRGQTDRPFRADLDFVCQAKSWRRLLEGFYAPAKTQAQPPPAEPPQPWSGPPELRAAAVAGKGEPWAKSYLDPCAWTAAPTPALTPANAHAARVLAAEIAPVLARFGVALAPARTQPQPLANRSPT
ncbi:hypothetical protein [Caulobacter sp. S45]|uniref:hypothetical protein n=1 Tax=Caulobacter sp. S45 TaxID=1641861 RepID=UPI00131E6361|nr:hypothetical protein [Caulobacter sp. S45]